MVVKKESRKGTSDTMGKRVGEIELFRFVFCSIILCTHSEAFIGRHLAFPGGSLSVEFFFLVSGYLMMASMDRLESVPIKDLGAETVGFLRRKINSVYPEYFITFVGGFLAISAARHFSLGQMAKLFTDNFGELLMIQRFGIGSGSINAVDWYVQVMMMCMAIIYPLIRKYPSMMKQGGLTLIALILLGWLFQEYGHLRTPHAWTGITYKGNIRAMAEICLGAQCFVVTKKLKQCQFPALVRVGMTAVKWLCWAVILLYMQKVSSKFKQDFFMLVPFCIAVILAFSKQCMDVPLYQNRIVMFLGKFSLPLYLCHGFVANYIRDVGIKGNDDLRFFFAFYAIACMTAFVVMAISYVMRKIGGKLANMKER